MPDSNSVSDRKLPTPVLTTTSFRIQPRMTEEKREVTLDLTGQGLLEWPVAALTEAPTHRGLNISRNKLNCIPLTVIPYLRGLRILNLSENNLTYISGQFLELLAKSSPSENKEKPLARASKKGDEGTELERSKSGQACRILVKHYPRAHLLHFTHTR